MGSEELRAPVSPLCRSWVCSRCRFRRLTQRITRGPDGRDACASTRRDQADRRVDAVVRRPACEPDGTLRRLVMQHRRGYPAHRGRTQACGSMGAEHAPPSLPGMADRLHGRSRNDARHEPEAPPRVAFAQPSREETRVASSGRRRRGERLGRSLLRQATSPPTLVPLRKRDRAEGATSNPVPARSSSSLFRPSNAHDKLRAVTARAVRTQGP